MTSEETVGALDIVSLKFNHFNEASLPDPNTQANETVINKS
ncbi:MAG TPA: hypothetical protein VMJ35_00800 [Dongiaceae bacterium]|nr:hypothetical protein [Dongiaceae bacterium]